MGRRNDKGSSRTKRTTPRTNEGEGSPTFCEHRHIDGLTVDVNPYRLQRAPTKSSSYTQGCQAGPCSHAPAHGGRPSGQRERTVDSPCGIPAGFRGPFFRRQRTPFRNPEYPDCLCPTHSLRGFLDPASTHRGHWFQMLLKVSEKDEDKKKGACVLEEGEIL